MTSLDCPVGPQVVYPESVETIPFQKFDATASASLLGPIASPPEGEVFRLAVAGRLLMAADDEELGPVDENVRGRRTPAVAGLTLDSGVLIAYERG